MVLTKKAVTTMKGFMLTIDFNGRCKARMVRVSNRSGELDILVRSLLDHLA